MKRNFFFGAVILFIFSSCRSKVKVRLIGHRYVHETITLHVLNNNFLKISPKENYFQENNIGSFNTIRTFNSGADFTLLIRIDSSNIPIFDTSIVVLKEYVKPFISFSYPNQYGIGYKRKIFIADEADTSFHKE